MIGEGTKIDFCAFSAKIGEATDKFNRRFADFDLLKTKLELFNNPMEVDIESQASCFQLELCELQADPFQLSKKNERYDVFWKLVSRGGVEDTRLETKDTKKIRGQGQPFRGQTFSRPRTGMLEAKDQGHKRKCSPRKKKVFTKIFQATSKKKKGLHKNFSGNLHKKTSSKKFFKRSTEF